MRLVEDNDIWDRWTGKEDVQEAIKNGEPLWIKLDFVTKGGQIKKAVNQLNRLLDPEPPNRERRKTLYSKLDFMVNSEKDGFTVINDRGESTPVIMLSTQIHHEDRHCNSRVWWRWVNKTITSQPKGYLVVGELRIPFWIIRPQLLLKGLTPFGEDHSRHRFELRLCGDFVLSTLKPHFDKKGCIDELVYNT